MTSVSASLPPSLAKDIAVAFGSAKKAANGYVCHCPVCNDSFLAVKENELGGVSFSCSKGCDERAIWGVAHGIGIFEPELESIKQKPRVLRGSDWLEQPIVESPPILQGLFDEGDKVLIVAQSKARKSFFTLQLALAIASSRRFLEFDTYQKRVLIIQFEIKDNNYHARAKKMAQGLEIPTAELDNIFFLNARGMTRNAEEIEKLIRETVEEVKPGVVILDPLYKLIEGDESKIEDIKPLLRFFDSLAETTKAAVLYVHHDKKGKAGDQQTIDRGAGSGVLARDIDCGIYLAAHKDLPDTLVIDFIARNHAPVNPITTQWDQYRFITSSASPEKETLRNQKNKKVKNSEWIDRASKLIKEMRLKGDFEVDMYVFNANMRELGMGKEAVADVKALLIKNGVIEVESRKSLPGQSNKLVRLIGATETVVESELQSELKEYSDDLF